LLISITLLNSRIYCWELSTKVDAMLKYQLTDLLPALKGEAFRL
jgi:hypothetical protein